MLMVKLAFVNHFQQNYSDFYVVIYMMIDLKVFKISYEFDQFICVHLFRYIYDLLHNLIDRWNSQ